MENKRKCEELARELEAKKKRLLEKTDTEVMMIEEEIKKLRK